MSTRDARYIGDEALGDYARRCLARPRHAIFWDDRLYRTHAEVLSWADRDDDILAESNYHVALDRLACAAGDDAAEHIIDGNASHALVGSLRTIYVQVFDDNDDYTDAWHEAVGIMLRLQDYPILDEFDFSEREHEAWCRDVDEAQRWMERRHDSDNDVDRETIFDSMAEALAERCGGDGSGQVSWDWFEQTYAAHRDAYFNARAATRMN